MYSALWNHKFNSFNASTHKLREAFYSLLLLHKKYYIMFFFERTAILVAVFFALISTVVKGNEEHCKFNIVYFIIIHCFFVYGTLFIRHYNIFVHIAFWQYNIFMFIQFSIIKFRVIRKCVYYTFQQMISIILWMCFFVKITSRAQM